jgi:hypothetical protein
VKTKNREIARLQVNGGLANIRVESARDLKRKMTDTAAEAEKTLAKKREDNQQTHSKERAQVYSRQPEKG